MSGESGAPGLFVTCVQHGEGTAFDELHLVQPRELIGRCNGAEVEHAGDRRDVQPHRAAHSGKSPLAAAALERLYGLPVFRQYREPVRLGVQPVVLGQRPGKGNAKLGQVVLDPARLAGTGQRPMPAGLDQIRGRFFFDTLS